MSGNTSIATVDSNGNVTGQSAGQAGVNVLTNAYPLYAKICSADHAAPCPQEPIGGGGEANVQYPASTTIQETLSSGPKHRPVRARPVWNTDLIRESAVDGNLFS